MSQPLKTAVAMNMVGEDIDKRITLWAICETLKIKL
jgi:hypothetical protein